MTLNVAVVGATGLVGQTLLRVLEERRFPVGSLRAYATARSAGARVDAFGQPLSAEPLTGDPGVAFSGVDLAFFAAGADTSSAYARAAAQCGAFVVDKSSIFRLDPDVPLVVPEVNGGAVGSKRLVANPNCATIPLAVALAPIDREFGLAWLSVSTYQSVSGAGKDALLEMQAQLAGDAGVRALPRRIAGNVFPENGGFDAEGHGEEERKIAAELRKILSRTGLPVSVTSVRVPVAVGHAEAVSFATRRAARREEIRDLLAAAPGVRFLDGSDYATPLDAAGTDEVLVGRLRRDLAHEGAYLCWIVCDNLRKGAATNAVQIAENALGVARAIERTRA